MRVVVVGTSGAGKSTFAQALARARGMPHVELDALFWGPEWTPVDAEVFRARAADAAAQPAWVVDGNYSAVRAEVWPRATHIIWLNFSRWTVFTRIIWRTGQRVATGKPLWAGNRESFRRAFLSREGIVWWSFSTFGKNRHQYERLRQAPDHPQLQWVELRSPAQARAFLRQLAQRVEPPAA